jgi:hypothetical protein
VRLALALAGLLLLGAAPAPTGSFTMSDGPYREGGTVTFTFGRMTHVTRNDEVTLGVWCFRPDGSQLRWGNRNNPHIYEFNSFGEFAHPQVLALPVEGTGYACTARLVVVDWFKGIPRQAWVIDEAQFDVEP